MELFGARADMCVPYLDGQQKNIFNVQTKTKTMFSNEIY